MTATEAEPVNTEPPHIPGATIYDTHKTAEWIAITDKVYADVIHGAWIAEYAFSIIALPDERLWIHIESGWMGEER